MYQYMPNKYIIRPMDFILGKDLVVHFFGGCNSSSFPRVKTHAACDYTPYVTSGQLSNINHLTCSFGQCLKGHNRAINGSGPRYTTWSKSKGMKNTSISRHIIRATKFNFLPSLLTHLTVCRTAFLGCSFRMAVSNNFTLLCAYLFCFGQSFTLDQSCGDL